MGIEASEGDILTVGHSTRTLEEMLELLRKHEVACVLDVRAHPGSRRMPHFASEPLAAALRDAGIEYVHVPELGGRRRSRGESPNGGWRKDSFRAYADHMATEEFRDGLERVARLAHERRCALMCAEALWWRCHRRLVADALVARGWRVLHVNGPGPPDPHELTPFAEVGDGAEVTYPPPQEELDV